MEGDEHSGRGPSSVPGDHCRGKAQGWGHTPLLGFPTRAQRGLATLASCSVLARPLPAPFPSSSLRG